jgi:hypothetical protein
MIISEKWLSELFFPPSNFKGRKAKNSSVISPKDTKNTPRTIFQQDLEDTWKILKV